MTAFNRRGFTLIEVLVALMMLATIGITFVEAAMQATASLRAAIATDDQSAAASHALARLTTWNRDSFAANTGQVQRGAWTLIVSPRGDALFDVEVRATPAGAALLRTTMLRRESTDAPR